MDKLYETCSGLVGLSLLVLLLVLIGRFALVFSPEKAKLFRLDGLLRELMVIAVVALLFSLACLVTLKFTG